MRTQASLENLAGSRAQRPSPSTDASRRRRRPKPAGAGAPSKHTHCSISPRFPHGPDDTEASGAHLQEDVVELAEGGRARRLAHAHAHRPRRPSLRRPAPPPHSSPSSSIAGHHVTGRPPPEGAPARILVRPAARGVQAHRSSLPRPRPARVSLRLLVQPLYSASTPPPRLHFSGRRRGRPVWRRGRGRRPRVACCAAASARHLLA